MNKFPYWNASCAEISKKLLLCTNTKKNGADLNSSNLLSVALEQSSWFSIKPCFHQNENLPISSFFLNSENTVTRSKKIRIYPQNSNKLNNYLGISRYWYNQAIEYLRQPNTKAILSEVRKIQKNDHSVWAFDCPQRIRDHAINDACLAVKNAKLKYLQTKQYQKVGFKTKKNLIQGLSFDRQSLKQNFVFNNKKDRVYFKSTEVINPELEGTKIIKENGKWFVIIPKTTPIKKPESQRFGVVALDPGIRTFLAYYSEGFHGKIGEGDFNRIFRLCLNLDKMVSKSSKCKAKQRKSIKKACQRLRWKIKNLINDLHKKTANFLVKHFDVILIPTFETSQMASKLRSKTARMMLSFAHYRFKQFLKAKAEEYSCKVIEVSEAWTSRTCSYCGKIHSKNSRKIMKCDCGAIVDRDLNGARGIYIRALRASSTQVVNNLSVNVIHEVELTKMEQKI